jgi:hypothetical protein
MYVGKVGDQFCFPSWHRDNDNVRFSVFDAFPSDDSSLELRSKRIQDCEPVVIKPCVSHQGHHSDGPGSSKCVYKSFHEHVYKHIMPRTPSSQSVHVKSRKHDNQFSDVLIGS